MKSYSHDKQVEFLDSVRSSLRLSLTVTAAPMLLIISQLKVLLSVQILCVQALVTISFLCLFVASVYQFWILVILNHLITVRKVGDLVEDSFPAKYFGYVDPQNILSEEKLLSDMKLLNRPFMGVMLFGWLCAIIVVLIAIWS